MRKTKQQNKTEEGPPVPSSTLQRQGEALIRFQKRSREWVKRRIEVVRFIDHVTMERETTLDLELSPEILRQLPTLHGRTLLPIKLLKRQPSLNVTVRDASGTPLPQLNRMAERKFVAAGLVYKYREGQADREEESLPDPGELFRDILVNINSITNRPFTTLRGPAAWKAIYDNYMEYRLVVPEVDLRPHIDKRSKGAILRLVVSYPERLPDPARDSKKLETVDDWPITLEVDQLEACESFHFELIAPTGISVRDDGTLRIWTEKDKDPHTFEDTDAYPDRAHFFCTIPKEWTTRDNPIRKSSVELVLRPMNEGATKGLVWTAGISAFTIFSLFVTVGWSSVPELPRLFPEFQWRYDTQSIVAALLLGPTLLSTMMIQNNEHMMTKRILGRLRGRVLAGGIATFVASLAFALGPPPWVRFAVLALLTAVTALMIWTDRKLGLVIGNTILHHEKPQGLPNGGRTQTDSDVQG
ncbi:MAG: FUSC family protein [Egibacteraceae bacterium]